MITLRQFPKKDERMDEWEEIVVLSSQDVTCKKHEPLCRGVELWLSAPRRRVNICLECLGEELANQEKEMDEAFEKFSAEENLALYGSADI